MLLMFKKNIIFQFKKKEDFRFNLKNLLSVVVETFFHFLQCKYNSIDFFLYFGYFYANTFHSLPTLTRFIGSFIVR